MAPIKANPYSQELGVFNQNPWVFHSWNKGGVEIYICVCVCVCVCIHICNVLSDGHFGNFLKMAPLKLFYLWTALGLCCYLRAFFFLVAASRCYILAAVHKLPIVVVSLFGAHGLRCPAACGIFPDQGLNLCPLVGRFLTTGLPGKTLE